MILSAHQPAYLPWLGQFHKIALADKFVFFDQVQYDPEDWVQRNKIKTPQGPTLLSVPVYSKGHLEKSIGQIKIQNEKPWRRKHWRTIYESYAKAPHFKAHADFFENLYQKDWDLLADLNFYILTWILGILGIKTPVERAGDYDFKGSKSDLVLDMCQQMNANGFIFGAQGKEYANTSAFEKAGINLIFQKYNHPTYRQLYGDFVPTLSVIDLLFNEGPNSLEILMAGNLTKEEILKSN